MKNVMKIKNLLKPRMLTGDTPTGKLHLGHLVGSLENRVKLQKDYDSFFIIADNQALTKNANVITNLKKNVFEVTVDYLSVGIDPALSNIFIQSQVPSIAQLTMLLGMFVPYNVIKHNPTIKQELVESNIKESFSCGFINYPISQAADILIFRPQVVPVGIDQLPHIELTRDIARKLNYRFFSVPSNTSDQEHVQHGGLFPIVTPVIGNIDKLIGVNKNPNAKGVFPKMSKSLNNAIFLSDSPDIVSEKIKGMYTDPKSSFASKSNPVTLENNPLWIYHKAFNPDKQWVKEAGEKYMYGDISNIICKEKLIEVINELLRPIQDKRKYFIEHPKEVIDILNHGTKKANEAAEETLSFFQTAVGTDYFDTSEDYYCKIMGESVLDTNSHHDE